MKRNRNTLSLLNFEGDALWVEKIGELFTIYDQHNEMLATLNKINFLQFIDGFILLIDSNNHRWNYANEHKNAKPSNQTLMDFIG